MTNLTIAFLISVIGLDTTIAFQMLISQPIFACTIIGYLMGEPMMGLEIGAIMQLLWLNMLPIGAARFPEGNIASMLVSVLVIRYAGLEIPNLVFAAAFAFSLLISYVGAQLTELDRRLNTYILQWAEKAASRADLRKLTLLDVLSVVFYIIIMTVMSYIALNVADSIIPKLTELPKSWEERFFMVKPAVWGMGFALTLSMFLRKFNLKNKS